MTRVALLIAVCAGAILTAMPRPRWLAKSAAVVVIVGLLLVGLSATRLPSWFYALAGGTTVVWLVAERLNSASLVRRRRLLRAGVVIVWLVGALMELPYQFGPRLEILGRPTLHVIGDSVTAGMGDRALETWPQILARSRNIEVKDYSRPGATVRSALEQAKQLPAAGGVVLLEIGGNDVLGSTSATEFEQSLELLLRKVCTPGRVVLMLELPLPPFQNPYGRAQRRLAAEHGVHLVPKRFFAEALAAQDATIDSIHLSKSGREQMAERVWNLIRP